MKQDTVSVTSSAKREIAKQLVEGESRDMEGSDDSEAEEALLRDDEEIDMTEVEVTGATHKETPKP